MAQADGVVANGTGAAVRSDLNGQLAALFTNHSGSTEPSTTYAYQWWADTNANLLKIRNSANNAWITLRELDGTLLMEDGSASTPGLSFASDTNTGFFSGGADKIGFATGGAERLEIGSSEVVFNDPSNDVDFRVESNGNTHMLFVDAGNDAVGIGTSGPADYSSSADDLVIAGSGQRGITIASTDSNQSNIFFADATSGSGEFAGYLAYIHSSDAFAFGVNGSEAARIDSSGRLLVGTSSTSATNGITVQATSATNGAILLSRLSAPTGDQPLGFVNFSDNGHVTAASISAVANGGTWTSGSSQPTALKFSTTANGASSTTERLRIDSSGNLRTPEKQDVVFGVDVNTSSGDGGDLTVKSGNGSGSGNNSGNLYLATGRGSSAAGNGFIGFGVAQTTNTSGFDTEYARIDSSGRLLVGETSASGAGRLVVSGNTVNNEDSIVTIDRGSATTSSGQTLGRINFTNGGDGVVHAAILCQTDGTSGSNDNPGRILFSTTADGASSPTEQMRLRSDGILFAYGSYNNTTANAANMFFGAGGDIGRSTSSSKYKTGIEDIEDSYSDALLGCRPVWYRSTCKGDNPDHGWWGFIAEEVAEIDPRLVHWKTTEITCDENGSRVETPCDPEPESVAYERFVPHLLNLLKRQQSAIETLETKVAALEAG